MPRWVIGTIIAVILQWEANSRNNSIANAESPLSKNNSAYSPSNGYLGSQACAKCHQEIFASWQKDPHARSLMSLGKKRTHPQCLACHVTFPQLSSDRSVGCEACHGPGGGYAFDDIMRNEELAKLLGLVDLSLGNMEKRCLECHSVSTKVTPFDAKKAWEKIAHPPLGNE